MWIAYGAMASVFITMGANAMQKLPLSAKPWRYGVNMVICTFAGRGISRNALFVVRSFRRLHLSCVSCVACALDGASSCVSSSIALLFVGVFLCGSCDTLRVDFALSSRVVGDAQRFHAGKFVNDVFESKRKENTALLEKYKQRQAEYVIVQVCF